jgi:hypothetical protein
MPKLASQITRKVSGMSILLVGEAGSGKTNFFREMANGDDAKPNVYIADFDFGVPTLRGTNGIAYDTYADAANGKEPNPEQGIFKYGYAFVAFDQWLNDAHDQLRKGTFPYEYVGLDSITMLAELVKNNILGSRKQMEIQDWGAFYSRMSDLIRRFTTLPGVTKIAVSHVERAENALTKAQELLPFMQGKFQSTMAAYFDEVYYATVRSTTKDSKVTNVYELTAQQQGMYKAARSRWIGNTPALPNSWNAVKQALEAAVAMK